MNKKRKLLLLIPLISVLSLASCGEQSEDFENTIVTSMLSQRFAYNQNYGPDGIGAPLDDKDPSLVSKDDTIDFTAYLWGTTNELKGYFENGVVTMEDALREDVVTDYGNGYPVTSIGANCFSKYTDIKGIHLGKYISSIGASAFYGLAGLTDINISDLTQLSNIGEDAFTYDVTETVDGENVTSYHNVPWFDSYILNHDNSGAIMMGSVLVGYSSSNTSSEITIPEGVTEIYQDAFANHSEIKKVNFPASLQSIGKGAFKSTGLLTVSIPDSVEYIGNEAFGNCTSLSEVNLGKAELGENVLLDDNAITKLVFNGGRNAYTLFGETATMPVLTEISVNGAELCAGAFSGLTALTKVDFTNSVKVVQKSAFSGCENLATIANADSVEFSYDNSLTSSLWYSSQADGAIYLGTNLLAVKGVTKTPDLLKAGITGVSKNAMKGVSGAFSMPSSIKFIGESGFASAEGLTDISLPEAKYIGTKAFSGCYGVTSIELADDCEISKKCFEDCEAVTSLALPFSDNLFELFGDNVDLSSTLTSYKFLNGSSVKTIPDNMFEDYTALAHVDFGSSVKYIGAMAFSNCPQLTEINLPVNVISFDNLAFANCKNLTTVNFEVSPYRNNRGALLFNGLHKFGYLGFFNCTKLTSSTVNGCAKTEGTFMMPESLTSVNGNILMGTGVKTIEMRVIDYYFDGVISHDDIVSDQDYIVMNREWNADPTVGVDEYGNSAKIPYTITIINSADYE